MKKKPEIFVTKKQFEEATKEFFSFFGNQLNERDRGNLLLIQASGLHEGISETAVAAFNQWWGDLPLMPDEIVLWRGGSMNDAERPYISASYSKDVASRFAKTPRNLHKIIVRTGARILPMYIVEGRGIEADVECEVVIESAHLKKRFGYYEYTA